MEHHLYHYRYTVTRIIDGDTLDGILDTGFKWSRTGVRIRMLNVYAAEIKGKTKAAGMRDKASLEALLKPGDVCVILSHSDKLDSFGRILATIWQPGATAADESVNDKMRSLLARK